MHQCNRLEGLLSQQSGGLRINSGDACHNSQVDCAGDNADLYGLVRRPDDG